MFLGYVSQPSSNPASHQNSFLQRKSVNALAPRQRSRLGFSATESGATFYNFSPESIICSPSSLLERASASLQVHRPPLVAVIPTCPPSSSSSEPSPLSTGSSLSFSTCCPAYSHPLGSLHVPSPRMPLSYFAPVTGSLPLSYCAPWGMAGFHNGQPQGASSMSCGLQLASSSRLKTRTTT